MEKSNPNLENLARSASERTLIMAEEKLGLKVAYKTYTAENYQDKTYDEVALDRARNNMDDMYLLNPDVIQILGEEDSCEQTSFKISRKYFPPDSTLVYYLGVDFMDNNWLILSVDDGTVVEYCLDVS